MKSAGGMCFCIRDKWRSTWWFDRLWFKLQFVFAPSAL